MSDVPTAGQISLLLGAIGFFAGDGLISLDRLRADNNRKRIAAKACLYWGVLCGAGVLLWHSVARRSWLPLEDNFDALVWLGVLLALFVSYTQRVHPLRGLEWFVMPIVMALLVAAAVFGRARPHAYVGDAWLWVHLATTFGGAVAFAVAGAGGTMYLVADQRLRTKKLGFKMASLERLEHLTFLAVTLGFALLTIGLITGLVLVLADHSAGRPGAGWRRSPKIALALSVWIVYAIVLHSPINPRFRGRRAAMLSVVGFALMIGALVAVQFMPAR